jgi:hypothetical protein
MKFPKQRGLKWRYILPLALVLAVVMVSVKEKVAPRTKGGSSIAAKVVK